MFTQVGWVAACTSGSTAPLVTKAAATDGQHVLFGVAASWSAADVVPKILSVLDSTTVIARAYVGGAPVNLLWPQGVTISPGHAASASLEASSSVATFGLIALHGATVRR